MKSFSSSLCVVNVASLCGGRGGEVEVDGGGHIRDHVIRMSPRFDSISWVIFSGTRCWNHICRRSCMLSSWRWRGIPLLRGRERVRRRKGQRRKGKGIECEHMSRLNTSHTQLHTQFLIHQFSYPHSSYLILSCMAYLRPGSDSPYSSK